MKRSSTVSHIKSLSMSDGDGMDISNLSLSNTNFSNRNISNTILFKNFTNPRPTNRYTVDCNDCIDLDEELTMDPMENLESMDNIDPMDKLDQLVRLDEMSHLDDIDDLKRMHEIDSMGPMHNTHSMHKIHEMDPMELEIRLSSEFSQQDDSQVLGFSQGDAKVLHPSSTFQSVSNSHYTFQSTDSNSVKMTNIGNDNVQKISHGTAQKSQDMAQRNVHNLKYNTEHNLNQMTEQRYKQGFGHCINQNLDQNIKQKAMQNINHKAQSYLNNELTDQLQNLETITQKQQHSKISKIISHQRYHSFNSLHTTFPSMNNVKFSNFDSQYQGEIYTLSKDYPKIDSKSRKRKSMEIDFQSNTDAKCYDPFSGEISDSEDLFSTLDSTSSLLSCEDEGEDLLPFAGVKYTTYEEGSAEHHLKVLKDSYNDDKLFMENMYKIGLTNTEFNTFFNSLSIGSDCPDLLNESIKTYKENKRMEALYSFYRCLTSKSFSEKHRLIAMTWILFIYCSSTIDPLRHLLVKSSSANRLFPEIEKRLRTRSCASIVHLTRNSENTSDTPIVISKEMEAEIASHVLTAAERFHLLSFQVAELYRVGRGVEKDLVKAYNWYKRANNDTQQRTACLALGLCHANGFGCERDLKIAESYFLKAHKQKDLRAKKFLQRCQRMIQYENLTK